MSLFGPAETIEVAHPVPNKEFIRWSDLERLNRERDLIGIYISGHPLDAYKIIIENVCTCKVIELEDLPSLAGRDLTIGGIVTNVREGQARNGKPFGIVRIEDYNGQGEIALFGDQWAQQRGYFSIDNSLFITARVEPRRFKEDVYDLNIGRVEFLSDIKDQKIQSITLTIRLDTIEESEAAEIATLLEESNGPTEVFFNIVDLENEMHVLLQSRKSRITVDSALIRFLEEAKGIEYKIN